MTSEAATDRLNPPTNISLPFVAVRQRAVEGQSDRMAPGMEVNMKQRCLCGFLRAEWIQKQGG